MRFLDVFTGGAAEAKRFRPVRHDLSAAVCWGLTADL